MKLLTAHAWYLAEVEVTQARSARLLCIASPILLYWTYAVVKRFLACTGFETVPIVIERDRGLQKINNNYVLKYKKFLYSERD